MINIGPGKDDLRYKRYPRSFDMFPPDDVYLEDKQGVLKKVVSMNQKISFEQALDLGLIKSVPGPIEIEHPEDIRNVNPAAKADKKVVAKETTTKKKLETK